MPTAAEMADHPSPLLWISYTGISLLPWNTPPDYPIMWSMLPPPNPMSPLQERFEEHCVKFSVHNLTKREFSGIYECAETQSAWHAFQAGHKLGRSFLPSPAVPACEPSVGTALGPLTLASFQRDITLLYNAATYGCGSQSCIIKPLPPLRGKDTPCGCTVEAFHTSVLRVASRLQNRIQWVPTEKPRKDESLRGQSNGSPEASAPGRPL
jgi:hypothetical protein